MLYAHAVGFHYLYPTISFETMPNDYAALVLIGGFGWFDELEADKVVPIVRRAIKKGIIVGAICNAASFLAKHGFLNEIKHTGNGLEQLQLWGGGNYTNKAGYMNEQLYRTNALLRQMAQVTWNLLKSCCYCWRMIPLNK